MNTRRLSARAAIVLFWFCMIVIFLTGSSLWFHPERKSINVCAWSGMFDLQWISLFEKETGIRVNISYYESNEELLVKLRTASHGYDLILPSDYMVKILRKHNMLKKLNKRKMNFYQYLNPLLMGHYFDPYNDYSVPFEWSVYGLGINKDCYTWTIQDESWGLIFDKKLVDSHVVMMSNDPLIAVPIAALYLFGTMENLSQANIHAIERVLKRQRSFVEAYTDLRASYYLSSRDACIAVCSISSIAKAMREYRHLGFIIPREGTLLTIENFALPVTTKKEELVYEFMNFMMKPESVVHSYEYVGFFPATTNSLSLLKVNSQVRKLLTMSKAEFERFHLLRLDKLKTLTEFELQNLWVEAKA